MRNESENRVLYYCHPMHGSERDSEDVKKRVPVQVKLIDHDNKDAILDHLGFEEENEYIRFVVHIMLRK